MAEWTTPQSWPQDLIATEEMMNEQIRDNLLFLFAHIIPTGGMIPFAGAAVPAEFAAFWQLCDGSALNRATDARLFAVIGTAYGAGNGATTFNVPDMRGRFPLGVSGSHALASAGGSETHTLTEAEVPVHEHTVEGHNHEVETILAGAAGSDVLVLTSGAPTGSVSTGPGSGETGPTGGGQAHSIMPPHLCLNWIIKR